MTCITHEAGNRHTTRHHQHESPAPGSARQNRYTNPLHTASAGRRHCMTLHPRRRREVAAWGGIVIEDDYDGEFRYDRQPVGALQALAPDHVIYAGTASKSLAPSLRLGWLVVPPRLLDAVTAELAAGPSGLDQLTLADFITSGRYDRQIRRARLAYRRRRDRLTTVLSGGGPHGQGQHGQGQHGQGQHVSGIAAGLHAVLDLPRTDLEHDMIARASKRGLALDGLERYRAGPGPVPGGDRAGLVIRIAAWRPRPSDRGGNAASPPRKCQWCPIVCSYVPVPAAPHARPAGDTAGPPRPRPVRMEPGRRTALPLAPRPRERPGLPGAVPAAHPGPGGKSVAGGGLPDGAAAGAAGLRPGDDGVLRSGEPGRAAVVAQGRAG